MIIFSRNLKAMSVGNIPGGDDTLLLQIFFLTDALLGTSKTLVQTNSRISLNPAPPSTFRNGPQKGF